MKYIPKKTYVLAIHGCPVWPVIGTTDQLGDIFPNFTGRFTERLNAVPEIHQTIDATGGFGRLDDASFEFLDTPDNDFGRFFASRLMDAKTPVKITDSILAGDIFVSLEDSADLSPNDDIYLPLETMKVVSIVDSKTINVERSQYSAFIEGGHAHYFDITKNTDGTFSRLLFGLEYGHWEHLGRWVALYEIEKGPVEEMTAPYPVTRLYAGTIREVSFDGNKITIGTNSVTTTLSEPDKISRSCGFDLDYPYTIIDEPGSYYFEIAGQYNDNTIITHLLKTPPISTNKLLIDYLLDELNVTLTDPGHSLHNWVLGYRLRDGRFEMLIVGPGMNSFVMPDSCLTSRALVKLLRLNDSNALVQYVNSYSSWYSSTGSVGENDWPDYPYDTVICPGYQFRVDRPKVLEGDSCYVQFSSGYGDVCVCKCIKDISDPQIWTVSTDANDLWLVNGGDNIEPDTFSYLNDRFLCVKASTCKIEMVEYDLVGDLAELLQREIVYKYQIPSWLVAPYTPAEYPMDNTWFHFSGYPVKVTALDQDTITRYEPSLKIAGYRTLWSPIKGQLVYKYSGPPVSHRVENDYTYSTVLAEKPGVTIGYQVPVTGISITFAKWNVTVNASTNDNGKQLAIKDEIFNGDEDLASSIGTNSVSLAGWLGTVLTSVVEKVDKVESEVGDIVYITNKYIASNGGYGIAKIPAMITDTTVGASQNIRALLASNLYSSMYVMLAPSSLLDMTVGWRGYQAGYFYLANDEFGQDFCEFLKKELKLNGPYSFQLRSSNCYGDYQSITLDGCMIDVSNNRVYYPGLFHYPSLFGYGGSIWITIADYWSLEE